MTRPEKQDEIDRLCDAAEALIAQNAKYRALLSKLTPAGLRWLEDNPDSVNRCGEGEAGVFAMPFWVVDGGIKFERIDKPIEAVSAEPVATEGAE